MADLSTSKSKEMRKKMGRPRVDATVLTLRLMPTQIAPLDAWIASHPEPRPSRPEAIRRILSQSLGKPPDAGSIAPEDLNASNDE
jgi:hypothetical protein